MPKKQTWTLYTREGHYLGQFTAYAPETALCEYMLNMGKQVSEMDVEYKPLNDHVSQLVCRSRDYFVVPVHAY